MWCPVFIFGLLFKYVHAFPQIANDQTLSETVKLSRQLAVAIGSCKFVFNTECPDPDVTFFMYSTTHPETPEQVIVGKNLRLSNLKQIAFDPNKPTKVIIHGYNSDMFLNSLTQLRIEYLKKGQYNVFTVDWSPLNQFPCYPAAVWNAKHVGTCSAQLIERIMDMGATDIHAIGFSLGAHIANYMAIALRPYKLPRITGLDPALPGFTTSDPDQKLDKTDAEFVDVYHTNAFMQGKAEESGHVDFYINGGAIQPGCWEEGNFFSCNHHRAPLYYAESITTQKGFWGWPCPNYLQYLLGRCPAQEPQNLMGEYVDHSSKGVYFVVTAADPPFAVGKYAPSKMNLFLNSNKARVTLLRKYRKEVIDFSGMDEESFMKELYESKQIGPRVDQDFANDVFAFSDNVTDIVNLIGYK